MIDKLHNVQYRIWSVENRPRIQIHDGQYDPLILRGIGQGALLKPTKEYLSLAALLFRSVATLMWIVLIIAKLNRWRSLNNYVMVPRAVVNLTWERRECKVTVALHSIQVWREEVVFCCQVEIALYSELYSEMSCKGRRMGHPLWERRVYCVRWS